LLKQRLDFPVKETKSMESMAIIQEQKWMKQRIDFPFQENIETMDRLAIIEEEKIFQPTVRISVSRKD